MKKKIALPVIVEGKYDKIKIDSIFDARVFVSGGFGVFNSKDTQSLLRAIAKDGVILLLDSDGGGTQIRSFLNSILPKEKIYNLYIPNIKGKEKRKTRPSAAGTLGVEGMEREILERVFSPFTTDTPDDYGCEFSSKSRDMITKVDLYADKLTGHADSSALRDELALSFGLPAGMSANALLEVLNIIADREQYRAAVKKLKETSK